MAICGMIPVAAMTCVAAAVLALTVAGGCHPSSPPAAPLSSEPTAARPGDADPSPHLNPAPGVNLSPQKQTATPVPPAERRHQALRAGVDYLLAQQDKDGAWRSDLYASFRDGTALTPLVVQALQFAYDAGDQRPALLQAIRRGGQFLAALGDPSDPRGPAPQPLEYPVYTAALTIEVFSHPTAREWLPRRAAWIDYLKQRQLVERNGWDPADKEYGGWGYCRLIPRKPKGNEFTAAFTESNLSATVFALQALSVAGRLDEPTSRAALHFVRRCQNYVRDDVPFRPPLPSEWQEKYVGSDSQYPGAIRLAGPAIVLPLNDGGFFFMYDDPVRNKAGIYKESVPDSPMPTYRYGFASYGSTTADGYRALRLCGEKDARRLQAAERWLQQRLDFEHHVGDYAPERRNQQDAVYYYYVASAARACAAGKLTLASETSRSPTDATPTTTSRANAQRANDWAGSAARALLRRQQSDGRWQNGHPLVREDEPLLATAYAVIALAIAEQHLGQQ